MQLCAHTHTYNQVLSSESGTFPVLFKTLSDPSEEVVKRDLELLAQLACSKDAELDYFKKVMASLATLFSTDRNLLEARGSLIVRELCRHLDAERIYRTFAEILESQTDDWPFASTMVQNLNTILVTAPELRELRNRLKRMHQQVGREDFQCQCHRRHATNVCNHRTAVRSSLHSIAPGHTTLSPRSHCVCSRRRMSTLLLCFVHCMEWGEYHVLHAPLSSSRTITTAPSLKSPSTCSFKLTNSYNCLSRPCSLVWCRSLVIAQHRACYRSNYTPIPSPHALPDLRLQLLEPEMHPYLFKCMYGLLMLLPQSAAFATLRNRLSSVSNLGSLQLLAGAPSPSRGNVNGGASTLEGEASKDTDFAEMLVHFRAVQLGHARHDGSGGRVTAEMAPALHRQSPAASGGNDV